MADSSRIGGSSSSAWHYQETQAGGSSRATNDSESSSRSRVSSWLSENSLKPMTGRDWAEQNSQSSRGSRRVPQASIHYRDTTIEGLTEQLSELARSNTLSSTVGQLGSSRWNTRSVVSFDPSVQSRLRPEPQQMWTNSELASSTMASKTAENLLRSYGSDLPKSAESSLRAGKVDGLDKKTAIAALQAYKSRVDDELDPLPNTKRPPRPPQDHHY